MEEGNNSFVFYESWYEVLKDEKPEIQWEVIHAVMEYVFREDLVGLKPQAGMAFKFIKRDIDRAKGNYEKVKSARSDSGRLGNLKRWSEDLHNEVIEGRLTLDEAESIAKGRKSSQKVAKGRKHRYNVNDNDNVNDNEKENNRTLDVFDFLQKESPQQFELKFLMPFSKKIKDLKKFKNDFNDKIVIEEIEWIPKKLFARLRLYARNWIENQDKFSKTNETNQTVTYDRF